MHNFEIAQAFYELADLLALKEENFFKIRAYRQAARTIAGLEQPVEEMYRRKTLYGVPGIGKNIIAKIGELVEKGQMDKLEKLRGEVPQGLREIMALPGIGARRAGFLHRELGVTSLEQLEQAAREKRIRLLKGMGAKTEAGILNSINMVRNRTGKFLLGAARELAQELTGHLEGVPGVARVAVAGSVRRWRETVKDVDLLAACRDYEPVLDALARHPRTREIVKRKENYIMVDTWWGIPVELVTVHPEDFWIALLWETGSEGHLEELARHALEHNWELTAEGLISLEPAVSPGLFQSEEDIYSRLGLKYIPPELREGTGEVVAARESALPDLVRTEDIRGDLHIHTQWSDGAASIGEMVEKARGKGYSYMAVTDHSQSLKIAGGLSPERLAEQYEYIDRLNGELDGFRVLKGVEVDILSGGGLDFDDTVLEQADVVVASVHSGFKQDRKTITDRILEAVRNRHVDIIGHLTGRLLGRREPYAVDVEAVLEEAGKYGKILEINASPDRLDLNDNDARLAVAFGARIAINTDAHDLRRMDEMEYGVAVARRAGLEAGHVVNTLELDELMKILKK